MYKFCGCAFFKVFFLKSATYKIAVVFPNTHYFEEVENKISDYSGWVKKIDYDTKILGNEKKYFTTSYRNKFTK